MRAIPLLLLFLAFGCVRQDPQQLNSVYGYKAVYVQVASYDAIAAKPAQSTAVPGKIYAYQQWLFQVDQFTGIHIIDNSNPAQARKIAFLQVPGATEISIKGNYLYTNNGNDLVTFSLATITAPQLVERIKNAFPQFNAEVPPVPGAYFECPDPSKGIVVAWEQAMLDQPKCRR